ncbi:MAG: hypothetical protein M1401_19250 [Chloroflexi bacterium]|nr:hypothetical protein [Chloroflexota bacterium]MCL5110958.1 hypothetical protein [Chloroflexota bacterium]
MSGNPAAAERERHVRALLYACTSFLLALVGYLYLGFDRGHTIAYAVAAYVILNALNHRAMFGRLAVSQDQADGDSRQS